MKVLSKDDASNLSNLLKDGDWMVLYYAEWCGHCQSMKPEWEKVISKIKQSNQKVNIADVKSDFIQDLQHKPRIEGFPTIKMYNNGKEVAKFQEDRVADKMEKFALSNSKSSNSVKPESKRSLEKLIEQKVSQKINNKLENKLEDIQQKIEKVEELPMIPIDISQKHSATKHSATKHSATKHSATKHSAPKHSATKHSATKHSATKSKSVHKISNIIKKSSKHISVKPTVKPMHVIPHAQHTQHAQQVPKVNIACNEIRKAKFCKSNPKCMFDYTTYKCKSKNQQGNTASHKLIVKPKSKSKYKSKTMKHTVKRSSNNNIKQSTKEVFNELIKSFGRIGKEAEKDSKLLSRVSKKL